MRNSKFRSPAGSAAHSVLRAKCDFLALLTRNETILNSPLITKSPCENGVARPYTGASRLPQEAILGVTSDVQLTPYIKIASYHGRATIPTKSEPFSRGVLFPAQLFYIGMRDGAEGAHFWFVFFSTRKRK